MVRPVRALLPLLLMIVDLCSTSYSNWLSYPLPSPSQGHTVVDHRNLQKVWLVTLMRFAASELQLTVMFFCTNCEWKGNWSILWELHLWHVNPQSNQIQVITLLPFLLVIVDLCSTSYSSWLKLPTAITNLRSSLVPRPIRKIGEKGLVSTVRACA